MEYLLLLALFVFVIGTVIGSFLNVVVLRGLSGESIVLPPSKCPKCGRPIVYSDDPKDKTDVQVREAEPDYHGKTILCAKCKTMIAVIEKPKVARGYVAIPIVREV